MSDIFSAINNKAFPEQPWAPGMDALLDNLWENVSSYNISRKEWSKQLSEKFSTSPASLKLDAFIRKAADILRDVCQRNPSLISKARSFAQDRFNKTDDLPKEAHDARKHDFFLLVNALKEALFVGLPAVVLHLSFATGDMFGIGAALVLEKNSSVILVNSEGGGMKDHTAMMKKFYESFLPPERVLCFSYEKPKVIPAKSNKKPPRVVQWTNEERKEMVSRFIVENTTADNIQWPADLDFGTRYLSYQNWKDTKARRKIRAAWCVSPFKYKPTYDKLLAWLHGRGLPVRAMLGKRVVVIWSRFSGKKGDIHIEHDTSFQGTRQLVDLALSTGNDYVIILGDKPLVQEQWDLKRREARLRKFTEIADSYNFHMSYGHPRVFDLTAYWEDSKSATWCTQRIDQFKLCEFLHRVCLTKHIGFRSGNMEALALLGYLVRYLEEPKSKGAERMERWHDTGLGYERITVSAVPTRSGKYAKSLGLSR